MRFVDEFRDSDKARALAAKISELCEPGRHYKLMEVCGGHTHTIYKHGIEYYLPEQITLVHGPGCPVCVIPMGRVDDAMALAAEPDVIMTSFGDMMRVPGSNGSFFDAKARGADIRMVYSPLDALKIARQNPGFISQSALKVKEAYAAYDAELIFGVPGVRVADPKACQCGEVLKGVLMPWECKVFGTACTPETPIGACMVSPEGACAAYYNYGRLTRTRAKEAGPS